MRRPGKMVDLQRDDAAEKQPDPLEYPPGACISLDEEMLAKLDLEKMPERGDILCFDAVARVEEVHDGRFGTHIALQITHIALDDDDAEDNNQKSKTSKRYGAKAG